MFDRSLALVEECGLTHLHVFPYSPRPETPAARMPQLDRALIKDRAAALRAAGNAALANFLAGEVGRDRDVLIERPGLGRTEQFAEVRLDAADGDAGQIVTARITSADAMGLTGTARRDAA